MSKFIPFILYLTFLINVSHAQNFENLVQSSWQNNQQLQAKYFHLKSAEMAYQEAKSLYFPELKFNTQYTLAAGGRSIDFPVGDLLNPVYVTLNQLTQSNAFSQINNVRTQFLPNNFYDAKLRITQPIFYPDIAIQKKLKATEIKVKDLEIKAFKRQLSRDVMIAFFQYWSSRKSIQIYESTDTLLMEVKRTTLSMIKNGIALPSALSRVENEIANLSAKKIEAVALYHNAENYLRFLVGSNFALDSGILITELPILYIESAFEREEVAQLKSSVIFYQLAAEKEDQYFMPKIGAQLDMGSQAFDFGFEPYLLFGINLEMNLLDHKKHKYRKDAASAKAMAMEFESVYLKEQFDLLASNAKQNLFSSVEQAKTFQARIKATESVYSDIFKLYKIGSANYLELLDAQTQVTQIKLQYLIAQNNAWIKWAEYIYTTASFKI